MSLGPWSIGGLGTGGRHRWRGLKEAETPGETGPGKAGDGGAQQRRLNGLEDVEGPKAPLPWMES